VVAADVDVVFTVQNFGTTVKDRKGTDFVSSIRALDAAAPTAGQQRLIVSANDSMDDRILYKSAGADDCLSKNIVSTNGIEGLLREHVATGLARVAMRS